MAGGDKKIHLHPNAGKNGFDKRPNEAGRPKNKRLFSHSPFKIISSLVISIDLLML